MAYHVTWPAGIGWQKIDENSTTQNHELGTIVTAYDPTYGTGEFIYLKGVASTVIGSAVHYNSDDFSTALVAADGVGPVAFAMAANVANQYGWYQISGKAVGRVLTGFSDGNNCWLTGTSGSLDDTAVSGDFVFNCKGASDIDTPFSDVAELEISRPFTTNGAEGLT